MLSFRDFIAETAEFHPTSPVGPTNIQWTVEFARPGYAVGHRADVIAPYAEDAVREARASAPAGFVPVTCRPTATLNQNSILKMQDPSE